jgi:hypothetical protein
VLGETFNGVEREVAASELWIGIKHDRDIDGVGDRAEIALDLRVLCRKMGLEDGQNAVDTEALVGFGCATALAVAVEATPTTTGTRPPAASIAAFTTISRRPRLR